MRTNNDLSKASDAALIKHFLTGHRREEAIWELIVRYDAKVSWAISMLPNFLRDEARSRAWDRVWRSLHLYTPSKGTFGTWIEVIARRVACAIWRKQERERLVRKAKAEHIGDRGVQDFPAGEVAVMCEELREILQQLGLFAQTWCACELSTRRTAAVLGMSHRKAQREAGRVMSRLRRLFGAFEL